MAFHKKKEIPFVSAVIVAAGASSRMDGVDKLQILLDGMPVVAHSIGSFSACPLISEVVVVCRQEQLANLYDLIRFYAFEKVTSVVSGGKKRQDSVFSGIRACSGQAEFYAIHDGARPLTLPEEIVRCLETAFKTGAAATGVPVKDTIKVVDQSGVIIETPDRDCLWAVQTPQIFAAKLYRDAMALAVNDGRDYTDDCRLVEETRHPVTMVAGSYGNIKITTPEDIAAAEAILQFRQGGFSL